MRQSIKSKVWQSMPFTQTAGQREALSLSHLHQTDERVIIGQLRPSRESLPRQ
ncbi:hypothetical protein D3C76_138890 [compost metagenome]